MKSLLKISAIVAVVLATANYASASKIEKAYEQLAEYDYFSAKKNFIKSLKKNTSAAAFGLATIYYRTDNPFHNIDSAYKYIRVSEETLKEMKSKTMAKLKTYGYSKKTIPVLKEDISAFIFDHLKGNTSVKDWTVFLEKNPDAKDYRNALFIRDSLAYDIAKEKNTSKDYKVFLETYPTSEFAKDAQAAFYLSEYNEQTRDGKVASYVAFIDRFLNNPYRGSAEDKIYSITTESNTVESLQSFLLKYKVNRNRDEAWRRLYQVFMYDYSDERIEKFQKDFPDYPFKEELKLDLQLARTMFVPAKKGSKFGAMDEFGRLIIPAEYDVVSFFHEGLALVGKSGKYGYINKANELVIPFQFDSGTDFELGRAVVEKGEKLGLIDRTGKMILETAYEDIGTFSEGLIYAQKDKKYGYYDRFGEMRIPAIYDEAFGFVQGIARVQVGDKQAFINTGGEYVLPPKYESLSFFTKDLLIFEENEYYGLINTKSQIVMPAEMDEIGQLSFGMAMINRDGLIGYIDSLGKIVIEPKLEIFPNSLRVGQFREYSANAKFKGKFGVIDRAGKFVLPNQYNGLGEFSGLMAFNKGKQWGFVNLQNKIEIQPVYDYAESFKSGGAIVTKGGFQGVIDMSGKELIPIQQDGVERMDLARYLINRGGQYGIYSADGKVIVPVEYDEIRQLPNEFYVLIKGNRLDYLYLPENKLIRLKN